MSSPKKFRGLTKDTKRWAFGYYCQVEGRHFIILNDAELDTDVICDSGITGIIEVLPETVGQFTGLHDKNGKEGYWQDISTDEEGDKYIIDWDDKKGVYYLRGIGLNCFGVPTEDLELEVIKEQEIIGNIHEHPELLPEADNGKV